MRVPSTAFRAEARQAWADLPAAMKEELVRQSAQGPRALARAERTALAEQKRQAERLAGQSQGAAAARDAMPAGEGGEPVEAATAFACACGSAFA